LKKYNRNLEDTVIGKYFIYLIVYSLCKWIERKVIRYKQYTKYSIKSYEEWDKKSNLWDKRFTSIRVVRNETRFFLCLFQAIVHKRIWVVLRERHKL
jgi:hypothetical protein